MIDQSILLFRTEEHLTLIRASQPEKNLSFSRTTGRVQVLSAEESQPRLKTDDVVKAQVLFGVVCFAFQAVLVLVSKSKLRLRVQGQPIYLITQVEFVPINQNFSRNQINFKKYEQEKENLRQLLQNNFLYSPSFNLTASRHTQSEYYLDNKFCWNLQAMKQIIEAEAATALSSKWFTPIVQGAIQGITLDSKEPDDIRKVQLAILYRRSKFMAGARFLSRGIDSDGNTANYVQTEILISAGERTWSYTMARGSVPIFWSQQSVGSPVHITKKGQEVKSAFAKHVQPLLQQYGSVYCVDLLSATNPTETVLSLGFKQLFGSLDRLTYRLFDYHGYSRGKDFASIQKFMQHLVKITEQTGLVTASEVKSKQCGIVRVNCLDCMDRTNIVVGRVCTQMIYHILSSIEFLPKDSLRQALMEYFKRLGDWVSRIYSGTDSTLNILNHQRELGFFQKIGNAFKSAERYYQQNFKDEAKHAAYLTLLRKNQQQTPFQFLRQVGRECLAQSAYSNQRPYRILVLTYNCADSMPRGCLFEGFDLKVVPDLIVVGLQQICDLNATNVLLQKNDKRVGDWVGKVSLDIKMVFGQAYTLMNTQNMVGLCLLVFKSFQLQVRNIISSGIRTGFSGYLGNKGATAVSLVLQDEVLSFINVHLCSGEEAESERQRLQDVDKIFDQLFTDRSMFQDRLQFKLSSRVFFFGDLNMRLKCGFQKGVEEASQLLKEPDPKVFCARLKELFRYDQLDSLKSRTRLAEFSQPEILFPPTYKYAKGSDLFDRKKMRVPSWCDRILYKGQGLCEQYTSLRGLRESDHRAVAAVFRVEIRSYKPEALDQYLRTGRFTGF